MIRYIPLAAIFGIIWCFVHGTFSLVSFIFGLLIGLLAIRPFRFLYRPEMNFRLFSPPNRIVSIIRYFMVLIKEIIKANIAVAKIVTKPKINISPGIIAVPIRCKTDLSITGIANTITLTPGTITVDISDDHSTLYVHCIDASDPAAICASIRDDLEKYVLEAFE
ncbi:MAG: Na+/H+ antiporter subunit E [Methanomethylovorans sp.]|uniref:Na+/H+ antiporter subunit E n=1 Tax=Methanomethylovorans sp. TaxID=2758717 RepID=UPI000A572BFE|nr:Na+/H+ antiporter subunit E [Methanomethylovorans sp.]